MDYRDSPEQARLRAEVREFVSADPAVRARAFPEDGWIAGFDPEFSKRLAARGWLGMTWPKQYGGRERSYLDRLIVTEELLLAGAPVAAHWFGDRQIGPALLAHGTPEQKAELVPRIARAEISFCIGMSEPDAGSDLAALHTRADLDGDEFVIRGQKIWTSFASHADYCYLVARTNGDAARHKGISELLVPMSAPGITVRPIKDMIGESHFGELFFDEVRVPRSALIGKLDHGFYQIMQQLDFERSGIERLISNAPLWRDAKRLAAERCLTRRDPALREQIAEVEIALRAGRGLIYRVAEMLSAGRVPNHEAAVAKTFCTTLEQRIADLVSRIAGGAGTLEGGDPRAALAGRAARSLLYAPAYTIQGGTNNVLRNIIATRGLGLPG
ncbi:MAG: acyl-CoA dehydrogenase [Deltaproteobacteria bacterium]|nr:acyl-CoA dehydrogenase [Deltaproteobacteria bacterium]